MVEMGQNFLATEFKKALLIGADLVKIDVVIPCINKLLNFFQVKPGVRSTYDGFSDFVFGHIL
jgi:hypothetical protein